MRKLLVVALVVLVLLPLGVWLGARRANELKRRATDFLGGLFKKKKGGG